MPQIEGLYVVDFGDVAIGGQTYTYWNGGVAVLETNRIFGGDSGYYYLGNYTIKDSQFEATVKIVKHNPTWEDAFGSTSPSFNVKVQATANKGIIEGFVDRVDPPQALAPDPPDMEGRSALRNTSSSIEPCACPSLHLLPPCCPAPPTPCLAARDGSSSPSGTAFERWCFATAKRSYCRAATRSP